MKRTLIPMLALCLALAACGVEQTPVGTTSPAPEVTTSETALPTGPAPSDGSIDIPDEPYSYLAFENEWLTLRDAYAGALES